MPEIGAVLAALDRVDLLALDHLALDRVVLGQLAEAGGEGDLAVVVQPLVGEEHDQALEPDLADGGDDAVLEIGGTVETVDLGPDGRAQGAHVEVDRADRHVVHGGTRTGIASRDGPRWEFPTPPRERCPCFPSEGIPNTRFH